MNKTWFEAAAVRAIKTVAQAAIAAIGSAAVLESVDWRVVVSTAILAGLLSLLTSVAGLPEVTVDSRDGIELKDEDVTEAQEKKGAEIASEANDEGEVPKKEGEQNE